ncbi:MAG: peptide chain release factor N(5)-glutamine methyltransferase [Terracidiphilus sp.]
MIAEGEYALAEGPHPERARLDSEALLIWLFRRIDPERNRAWLIAHWNNPADHATEFRALVQRRLAGEPIQYITGETEFYGLPFRVTRDVLIPRPETEHLVEKVIELAARFSAPHIVDVGTGSGCIAVALAHKLPHAALTAIDLSAAALDIAEENAKHNEVSIRFFEDDLLTPVAGERFEIVVSNPPYVPTTDRPTLSVEVRDYEPALALFAGDDGLEVYRRLIPQALASLVPGGFLVLEIGFGQSSAIADLLRDSGFQQVDFVPDLQSIPRVAFAQHP